MFYFYDDKKCCTIYSVYRPDIGDIRTPYDIRTVRIRHIFSVSFLCVFGVSHFGLYCLYSSTIPLHKRRVELKFAIYNSEKIV